MTTPAQSPSPNRVPITWKPLLCLASQEVFEMMAQTKLTVCHEPEKMKFAEFTSVVGLAGPITGIVTIRCTGKAAIIIASRMLGLPPAEVGADMFDALGEICNMVAGNFKSKLGENGEKTMLSVPTVIKGSDYRVRSMIDGAIIETFQQFDDELVTIKINCKTAPGVVAATADQGSSCEVSVNVHGDAAST